MTLIIWTAFYDCVLAPFIEKYTHQPRGLHPKNKLNIFVVDTIGINCWWKIARISYRNVILVVAVVYSLKWLTYTISKIKQLDVFVTMLLLSIACLSSGIR
ncbi:hypothetical protein Hanom_Chr00s022559g01761811 [Helianthus anomalus]